MNCADWVEPMDILHTSSVQLAFLIHSLAEKVHPLEPLWQHFPFLDPAYQEDAKSFSMYRTRSGTNL
jgi:hypothetical protein